MAIGRAIGKTAGWASRRPKLAMAGGVAAVGGFSATKAFVQSPAAGDAQEMMLGDRQAVQGLMRGYTGAAISPRNDVMGIGDYYYGQSITGPRSGVSSGAAMPVGGEIVFGQYNERRRG